MNDFSRMWSELGINLPDHDQLMMALPELS